MSNQPSDFYRLERQYQHPLQLNINFNILVVKSYASQKDIKKIPYEFRKPILLIFQQVHPCHKHEDQLNNQGIIDYHFLSRIGFT